MKTHTATLVITLVLCGCTSVQRERDQPSTTALGEPLTFSRDVSGLSTTARDYVYVGAIEASRTGVRRYLIWVGLASTIDRGVVGRTPPSPTRLRLELDDEVLDLPLTDWDRSTDARFRTAAPIYRTMGAAVSDVDLSLIADAGPDAMAVTLFDDAGKPMPYRSWHAAHPSWVVPADDDVGFSVVVAAKAE